jgi:hypothetical protein
MARSMHRGIRTRWEAVMAQATTGPARSRFSSVPTKRSTAVRFCRDSCLPSRTCSTAAGGLGRADRRAPSARAKTGPIPNARAPIRRPTVSQGCNLGSVPSALRAESQWAGGMETNSSPSPRAPYCLAHASFLHDPPRQDHCSGISTAAVPAISAMPATRAIESLRRSWE